jgi:hypothetical protein
MTSHVLSSVDVVRFERDGYLIVEDCFTTDEALRWRDRAYQRLGWDADEPATWLAGRHYLHTTAGVPVPAASPRLWGAITQLLGGQERVRESSIWDSFIVNVAPPPGGVHSPPSPAHRGWHVDGDSFRHFLDSPELGLVALCNWTASVPRGGCTFVACDSIPVVSRFLLDHPQGLLPSEFPFTTLVRECRDFREIVAPAGSVLLMHPFTLHSASFNETGLPRIVTNSNIALREPKDFDRGATSEYSPIERAVLAGLGRKSVSFRPLQPRERFESPRVVEARRLRERGTSSAKSPAT